MLDIGGFLIRLDRIKIVNSVNERRCTIDTLGNFSNLKTFANNKLFRMFALCMVVVLFEALAPCAHAEDFRFTVTADNRPNSEVTGAFQHVLSQTNQNVMDEGEFHISAGDIDSPEDTYQYLKSEFGSNVKWYPVVGNHETDNEIYMDWLRNYYDDHLQETVNQGPTNGVKTTYSWDYGNAHFIV